MGLDDGGEAFERASLSKRLNLNHVKVRPLYGRAAKDNIASLRVLEKCGFTICGEGRGFSNARGEEVEEFILRLRANERDEAQ